MPAIGTSTLYRTCPSHLPLLGKLLAHLKARLASMKWPRKVVANGSKFPAEGHDLGSMEPPKSHKPETPVGGKQPWEFKGRNCHLLLKSM